MAESYFHFIKAYKKSIKLLPVSSKFVFFDYERFGEKRKVAKLYMKKSYTNIFITMTDYENSVVKCFSAGMCETRSNSKRLKTSPQVIEVIMNEVIKYFRAYKITDVIIMLKMKPNVLFRFLLKELKYYNMPVVEVEICRTVAYVPMRGRKLRRK